MDEYRDGWERRDGWMNKWVDEDMKGGIDGRMDI